MQCGAVHLAVIFFRLQMRCHIRHRSRRLLELGLDLCGNLMCITHRRGAGEQQVDLHPVGLTRTAVAEVMVADST